MTRSNQPKKNNANRRIFDEYVVELGQYVITRYGASYATNAEMRGNWRWAIPYSAEIEKDLILRTRVYIRTLPAHLHCATDVQFLQVLTNRIADHLCAYTYRAPHRESRSVAYRELQDQLFNNFEYIRRLRHQQALNKSYHASPDPDARPRRKRIKAEIKRQYDETVANQVKAEFFAAQRLRMTR